jgi:hypothetical protein
MDCYVSDSIGIIIFVAGLRKMNFEGIDPIKDVLYVIIDHHKGSVILIYL